MREHRKQHGSGVKIAAVILVVATVLLLIIFRDQILDAVRNLWQPIGPGGLPVEDISAWN